MVDGVGVVRETHGGILEQWRCHAKQQSRKGELQRRWYRKLHKVKGRGGA